MNKKGFVTTLKEDYKEIGYFIIALIIIFLVLYGIYYVYSNFGNDILNFIISNLPLVTVIVLDISLLSACTYEWKKDCGYIVQYLFLLFMVVLLFGIPAVMTYISANKIPMDGFIVPHIVNGIFLVIVLPIYHAYLKHK